MGLAGSEGGEVKLSETLKGYGTYGLALLLALLLPQFVYPVLALDILLWALFAVALDLLLGFTGLLSFGHAMFWGSAGYTAAILARATLMPFPVAVLAGIVVATLLAIPIGWLSVRRSGIYFAMVTLAFAQMVFFVFNQARAVTGGENGLQGVPRLLPGVDLHSPVVFYYAALPFVLVGLWFAHRVVHSPFGHVLVAIRDNEARAQALGYPASRYKLMAFALSAALAGMAGALHSLSHGFASLDLVHWSTSGSVVIMTILGGIGTLWGSIVGAAIVLLLQDWLSTSHIAFSLPGLEGTSISFQDAPFVITGAIFIVIVLNFRHGVWGTLVRLRSEPKAPARLLRGLSGAHAAAEAQLTPPASPGE